MKITHIQAAKDYMKVCCAKSSKLETKELYEKLRINKAYDKLSLKESKFFNGFSSCF